MKRTLILAVMAVVTPTCGALAQSVVEIPSRSDTWMQDSRDERPPRERPSRHAEARADDDDEAPRTARIEERSSPPEPVPASTSKMASLGSTCAVLTANP